jgi:iron complex outermembrane receptor protein
MRKYRSGPGAVALGLALAVPAVFAQQAAESPAEQTLEKITVTGTLIPRTDTETAAPVQVISREQIAKSGLTSVNDVLHALTANGEGNLNQGFSGAFAAGAAGIALRGMSLDATLVLLDGHRMAPYPISDDGQRSFVDVSNLPLAAIERIEILKDGASAQYGSDAIAGVVNIILRKTIIGGEISGDIGTSYKGDGGTRHLAATYGFGDLGADGRNTYVNFEYRHQDEVSLNSRAPYNNFNYQPQWGATSPVLPGVVQNGSAYPIGTPLQGMILQWFPGGTVGSTPSFLSPCANPAPTGGCGYNPAQYWDIQPDTNNINLMLRHTQNFGGGWEANVTASLFQSKASQLNTPSSTLGVTPNLYGATVNTGDPTANPILIPVGNAANPYSTPAWLGMTFGDVGAQYTTTDTNMYRLVTDIDGKLGNWDVKTSLGYIRGITDLEYINYVSLPGLQTVLNNGSYVPGTTTRANAAPGVYSTLAPTTESSATSEMAYVEAIIGGDLPINLPGGPIGVSGGLHIHHMTQDDPGQPGATHAQVLGLGTTFISGSELDEALFGEVDLPVVKMLDLGGQFRWDKYPATGTAFVPKLTAKFTPVQMFSLRGTYGRGFRAPGPGERGNSGVTFYTSAPNDPLRCPTTNLPSDCGSGTIAGVVAGNPQLLPEKSESYTAGFVFEPAKWASFTLDWYKIRRVNEIIGGAGTVTYLRGPVQPAYPGLPGPIVALQAPYQNEGSDTTSGFDLDFKGKASSAIGDFDYGATYTHIVYQRICATPDPATCVDVAGTHGPSGISGDTGTPKDRVQASLGLTSGPIGGGFIVNYVSGYDNTDPTIGAGGIGNGGCLNGWYTPCHIASFTDVDAFGRYDLSKAFQLNAHILNLFNRAAPFDPQAAYGTRNYNNAFAQQGAIGRFFEVGFRYGF